MNPPRFFFSCDWGTTTFRLRFVAIETGQILQELRKPLGAKILHAESSLEKNRADRFAEVLLTSLSELSSQIRSGVTLTECPIVVSGMASSSVGWKELPYASTPFSLEGLNFNYDRLQISFPELGPLTVFLLSGVSTGKDVMRGEETEILGLFSQPGLARFKEDCLAILPGSHSKHVAIRQNSVIDFNTYLTGELYEVLARHSLLKASVLEQGSDLDRVDDQSSEVGRLAFQEAIDFVRKNSLAQGLFRVRTRTVLERISPAANSRFLSGLLIAGELIDLRETLAAKAPILLAAPPQLSAWYKLALERLAPAAQIIVASAAQMQQAAVCGQTLFLKHLDSYKK